MNTKTNHTWSGLAPVTEYDIPEKCGIAKTKLSCKDKKMWKGTTAKTYIVCELCFDCTFSALNLQNGNKDILRQSVFKTCAVQYITYKNSMMINYTDTTGDIMFLQQLLLTIVQITLYMY